MDAYQRVTKGSLTNCQNFYDKYQNFLRKATIMSEKYAELLDSLKWSECRENILRRDTYECQNCKNATLLEQTESTTDLDLKLKYIQEVLATSKSFDDNPDGTRKEITLEVTNVNEEKSFLDIYLNFFSCEDLDWEDVFENQKFKAFFYTWENYKEIVALKERKSSNWVFVKDLHVHHKYYQKGLFPWEYPDEALITMCWQCHMELHSTQSVKAYDENGIEEGFLTPCNRCGGAGHFPQYSHVKNGICFRCGGSCYEEFI